MLFGFPGRTTRLTTDPNGIPLVTPASQFSFTFPASTRRVMSGSTETFTTSAVVPVSTARDCSAEEPYAVSTATSAPSGVAANADPIVVHAGSVSEKASNFRGVSASATPGSAPPVWLDPSLQDITTIAESRSAAAVFHVAENRILSGWPAT